MDVYKLLPHFLAFLGHPAFSGGAIVAGFALLWGYAKNSEKISTSMIVDPYTKQPIKHPIYPAFRRAAWTCLTASILAMLVWSCYRTPLKSYIFIEELPKATINIPSVRVESLNGNMSVNRAHPKVAAAVQNPISKTGANPVATPMPSIESKPNPQSTPSIPLVQNQQPDPSLRPIEEWREISDDLYGVFKQMGPVNLVITAPEEQSKAKNTINQLVLEGDRAIRGREGEKIMVAIEGIPDPGGTDADIPFPRHDGILVHCTNTSLALQLTRQLQRWFNVHSTSADIPKGIAKYYPHPDPNWKFVWIEIGNGKVWR
ncbi:MAG: hypothetical protein ABSC77_14190 [Terracidiphilus sp.]